MCKTIGIFQLFGVINRIDKSHALIFCLASEDNWRRYPTPGLRISEQIGASSDLPETRVCIRIYLYLNYSFVGNSLIVPDQFQHSSTRTQQSHFFVLDLSRTNKIAKHSIRRLWNLFNLLEHRLMRINYLTCLSGKRSTWISTIFVQDYFILTYVQERHALCFPPCNFHNNFHNLIAYSNFLQHLNKMEQIFRLAPVPAPNNIYCAT